jgi:transcriptional regulator with XRE-family HTH domain
VSKTVKHLFSLEAEASELPAIIAAEMARRKKRETGFGKQLMGFRKARGLTQVQLAASADTTQRAVSYYENDVGYPPAPAFIKLAQALHITTDELLGMKPVKRDRHQLEPELRGLWKKLQQVTSLPDRDQRAVIRLINSLASNSRERRKAS